MKVKRELNYIMISCRPRQPQQLVASHCQLARSLALTHLNVAESAEKLVFFLFLFFLSAIQLSALKISHENVSGRDAKRCHLRAQLESKSAVAAPTFAFI